MRFFGYTKRTNFLVAVSLSQISEFSIIMFVLASTLIPKIGSEIVPIISLTLIITIIFSTYMINYSNGLYDKLSKILSLFEKKKIKEKGKVKKDYDAILFGYNRIGFSILKSLKKSRKNYLVVDFSPEIISDLNKHKIPCVYGDVYDTEFLDELPLDTIKLVVSTIPDFETNLLLIEKIKNDNPNAIIIVRAHQIKDALKLYTRGANYVLTPHFLGGEYISDMITYLNIDKRGYEVEKKKHIDMLNDILRKGH